MEKQKTSHNTVEKISFVLGVVVLLALISILIYQMAQKKETPPNLEITLLEEPSMEKYGFKLEIENSGGESAESANINLSLYQEGMAVENGTVTFQYVPVKSKKTAWIVFHTSKKEGDSVVVSSVTYVKP